MVDLFALRIEYTPAPPPECPICGAPMAWNHYVSQRNYTGKRCLCCPRPGCEHKLTVDGYTTGDQRVLDLIAEVEELRKNQGLDLVGGIVCSCGSILKTNRWDLINPEYWLRNHQGAGHELFPFGKAAE